MADMSNANDAECTDCGGSGVTYQTERRCSCKAGAIADAPDGTPRLTLYKRVEAILDEESAWIARPSAGVTMRVVLAAALAADEIFNERAVLERAIARMGWDEIHAFQEESRKGQSIFEDAGGYMLRCLRRLFGLPTEDREVVNYRQAAQRMVDEYLGMNAEVAEGSRAAALPPTQPTKEKDNGRPEADI